MTTQVRLKQSFTNHRNIENNHGHGPCRMRNLHIYCHYDLVPHDNMGNAARLRVNFQFASQYLYYNVFLYKHCPTAAAALEIKNSASPLS